MSKEAAGMTNEELLVDLTVGFVQSEGKPFNATYNNARAEILKLMDAGRKALSAAPRATGAREAAEDCVKTFVAADFTHLPLSDYKCKWAARIIEEAITACVVI